MPNRGIFIQLLIISSSFLFCSPVTREFPKAEKGVIDLRSHDFSANGPVDLDGEWEFYWKKFNNEINPGDKPAYIQVPSPWNKHLHNGKEVGPYGFATYRLKILLPDSGKQLAIKYIGSNGGSRFFINDKVYHQGIPEKNAAMTKPLRFYNIVPVESGTEIYIALDNASYFHRNGGIKHSFTIGNEFNIRNTTILMRLSEGMYTAIYLVLAVILLIFHIKNKNPMILFFSFFSLNLAARIFMVGERNIHIFFPEIDYRADLFMEYLTFYLSVVTLAPYIHLLLPGYFGKTIRNIFVGNGAAFIALIVILPSDIYSRLIHIYQATSVLFLIITLAAITRGVMNNIPTAKMQLASFAVLFAGAIIDIIYSIYYTHASSYTAISMLAFVLLNVIIISKHLYNIRLEKELSEKKALYDKLRMQLLETEKKLIKDDLLKTMEMQKKLEIANFTKNRFFSVISHDLRGSIGSVMELLEMVSANIKSYPGMTDRKKEDFREILLSTAEQSNTTYELLENLLDWALSQQDMIVYHKTRIDIEEIIEPAVNLLRMQASAKDIHVSIRNEVTDASIHADPRTCQTIIRNLLSNAVKFSHNDSKIEIRITNDDKYINISIQDYGPGMSPEKTAKLNQEQGILSTPGTNDEKGTGLGLQLVFEYIRGNNGKLDIQSEEDKGTTFTVSLPIAPNPAR